MKRILLTTIMVCFILGMTNQAEAFDGNRKGFILGLGLGYGQGTFGDGDNNTENGVCTNFKIGYGASEQVLIYWNSKAQWFKPEGSSDTWVYGVGGLGVSYFLKPVVPSFYFNAIIGFSSLSDGNDSETGSGMGIGAGYEFSKHYSAEVNYMFGNIDFGGGSDLDVSGIRVTFNALAF